MYSSYFIKYEAGKNISNNIAIKIIIHEKLEFIAIFSFNSHYCYKKELQTLTYIFPIQLFNYPYQIKNTLKNV